MIGLGFEVLGIAEMRKRRDLRHNALARRLEIGEQTGKTGLARLHRYECEASDAQLYGVRISNR